ncbi:MAG: hypothetical protein MI741_07400, partial [Rhodospirillales bacterium]|nr:hypothetical protein [Rhodospirillales bacterium]
LAAEKLQPLLEPSSGRATRIASSSNLKPLYHFGGIDLIINVSNLYGNEQGWIDWRTGDPVVTEPNLLKQRLNEMGKTLIICEQIHWRTWAVPEETADHIEALAEPVELPEDWGLVAFIYDSDAAAGAREAAP